MKKITLLFVLISLMSYAQKHPVEIVSDQSDKGVVISAKNLKDIQYEVTLTVNQKGLRGYKKPVTKLVPANSVIPMVNLLFIKGKKWSYSTSYRYAPKPTAQETAARKQKLKEKALAQSGDISKGIVVFSKDGCTRCHYVTSYLLDNKMDFKFLNTTENKDYNRLMWSILKEKVPNAAALKSVNMPVVLVNGELSYNMTDLRAFVSSLPK